MNFRQFVILSLAISIISCGRNLQDEYKKSNDKCSMTKATNENDCYAVSANSSEDNCCSISMTGGALTGTMCKNIKNDSDAYKSFDNFGGLDNMRVYLTTKMIGGAEVACSQKKQISEDVKTLANNCGNMNNPSVDNCNALSNENVQCCFYSTQMKNVGGLSVSNCAGVVAPVKMPSFSMTKDGEYNALMCGMNSQQKTVIDACGAVVPQKEEDCTKMSTSEINCRYASWEKKEGEKVNMCIGMKGDLQMMMDLGIEPRLRLVSLRTDETSFGRIGMSFTFLISLILFFLF